MRIRRNLRRAAVAALVVGAVVAPLVAGGGPVFAVAPPPMDPLPLEPHELQKHLAQAVFAADQSRQARAAAQAQAIADLAPEIYRLKVLAAATYWGLDPRLVASVITVETDWDPTVVGTHGELGLMQILPSTGRMLAAELHVQQYDLADIDTNLNFGCYYLHVLQEHYKQPELVLAAYNGGPRAAARYPEQGNRYAAHVLSIYNRTAAARLAS